MTGVPAPDVTTDVRWHSSDTGADEALRIHVGAVVGVRPGSVKVGRLCGRCGSVEHGRPWADHGVHVSLARSGRHLVTAVSTSGPVGVDVESVDAVDRAWEDLSALWGSEPVPEGTGRAAWWCRLEAALKRDGAGLADPVDLALVDRRRVDDLVAPAAYCAAVAVTRG